MFTLFYPTLAFFTRGMHNHCQFACEERSISSVGADLKHTFSRGHWDGSDDPEDTFLMSFYGVIWVGRDTPSLLVQQCRGLLERVFFVSKEYNNKN